MTNLVQFPGLGLSFELDRVAFSIGGMNIYWYGVCIAVGMCLALVFAFRHSVEFGVDADAMVDVILIGVVMGILCARLYYVALSPYQYHSLKDVLAIRDGGLAIYGGIIGAFLFGGLACKWRKVPVLPMFDLAAMGFLIGQGCGRWGNFFNQEAFGANTKLPWGMISNTTMEYISNHYDELGGKVSALDPIHPCFLYESIWCLIGFIILHFYLKHRKFDGEVFLMYTGWYGLGRFFIEGLRTDSLYLGNIRVSQLVAGTCVLASLVLIIVFRGITKRNSDYKLFVDTELSKAQLEQYNSYNDIQKEKKELKHKIKEAKDKGESFIELQKEYDEKFGKQAQKDKIKEAEEKDKESHTKAETEYKSILGDDNDEDREVKDTDEKDTEEE